MENLGHDFSILRISLQAKLSILCCCAACVKPRTPLQFLGSNFLIQGPVTLMLAARLGIIKMPTLPIGEQKEQLFFSPLLGEYDLSLLEEFVEGVIDLAIASCHGTAQAKCHQRELSSIAIPRAAQLELYVYHDSTIFRIVINLGTPW
jgi:hypothetical protein